MSLRNESAKMKTNKWGQGQQSRPCTPASRPTSVDRPDNNTKQKQTDGERHKIQGRGRVGQQIETRYASLVVIVRTSAGPACRVLASSSVRYTICDRVSPIHYVISGKLRQPGMQSPNRLRVECNSSCKIWPPGVRLYTQVT